MKLNKRTESGAYIFTDESKISTCNKRRFVFLNGDMSAGYWQSTPAFTEFKSIEESIKNWSDRAVRPSLKLTN